METLQTVDSPNFSIIVPGPCSMNCSFCFWKRDPDELHPTPYIQKLASVIKRLPPQFDKVSITGGEPTLSYEYLIPMLKVISISGRFRKVVLTTNGTHLSRLLGDPISDVIDFINISRHAIEDGINAKVFGVGKSPLPWSALRGIILKANMVGIPVTCNSIIHTSIPPTMRFIGAAKDAGFSEMCFRKMHTMHSDLLPTHYEQEVNNFRVVEHSECPVCRSDKRIIKGMPTWWTASIAEPSDLMIDKIYEAVLHPDGNLYADWSKNIEIEL